MGDSDTTGDRCWECGHKFKIGEYAFAARREVRGPAGGLKLIDVWVCGEHR